MARHQPLVRVLLATCVLWNAPWARAQDGEDNALFVPVVDANESCVASSNTWWNQDWTNSQGQTVGRWEWTTDGATFASPGWHGMLFSYSPDTDDARHAIPWVDPEGTRDFVPLGFRSNLSPLFVPSAGDFLPAGKNLAEHSTALLPPGGQAISTDWQGAYRQTLDGRVDLVTGLPLVQVTDLEIPFGAGATFRLTRTRSGIRNDALPAGEEGHWASAPDEWWDWAGMGWMLSENPVLLVDSALPDVTGDQPRTTYFVVDAHHSIPFQLIEANGVYEAPPRFRARMTHNGTWGVNDGQYTWLEPPTQFDIFLYDGSLHYTFVVVYENMLPNRWRDDQQVWKVSSYHDRPILPQHDPGSQPWDTKGGTTPGLGLPYIGLCVRIEDKSGHQVAIEYCDVRSGPMDDPSTADCVECMRRTTQLGQIRAVRLRHNGELEWTLVYFHRMFEGLRGDSPGESFLVDHHANGVPSDPPSYDFGMAWVNPNNYPEAAYPEFYELHGHAAVDRIYAFEEGEGLPEITDAMLDAIEQDPAHGLTIPHTETASLGESPVDPLQAFVDAGGNFRNDWKHRVRSIYHDDLVPPDSGTPASPPLLVRTEVATARPGGAPPVVQNRVYQYDLTVHGHGLGMVWANTWGEENDGTGTTESFELFHTPWLRFVFEDAGLSQLHDKWAELSLPGDFDLGALANNRPTADASTFDAHLDALSEYASVEYTPHDETAWPTSGTAFTPAINSLFTSTPKQLVLPENRLRNDNAIPTVRDVAYVGADGARRFFRINRLRHVPDGVGSVGFEPGFDDSGTPKLHFRSVFFHPYYWQTYDPNYAAEGDLVEAVALHEARWVALVDEYEDRATLLEVTSQYMGPFGTRNGQTSRRVLEMNPTGYVLRDRLFEFLPPDGVLASGGGLGEQFIYDTFANYAGLDDWTDEPEDDPWNTLRDELILVQHRSVGWSVGWDGNDTGHAIDEESKGLVRFFDYEADISTDTHSFESWPRGSRLQLVAEGIQRGSVASGETKYFTRQILHRPERPWEVAAEIEYTTETLAQDLWAGAQPPVPLGDPAAQGLEGAVVRQFVTDWDESDPDVPVLERRAEARLVIGPPGRRAPDSGWYYPVEVEFYDSNGNSSWAASGTVLNPQAPDFNSTDEFESLIFTHYVREGGLTRFTIVDANAGDTADSSSGASRTVPTWPEINEQAWRRIPLSGQGHPAFNAVTEFVYEDDLGLVDIYTPNDRRWSKRVVIVTKTFFDGAPKSHAREYIFNDLYVADNSTGDLSGDSGFFIGSPGEVNDYPTEEPVGAATERRRVMFDAAATGTLALPQAGNPILPEYTEYWRVEMGLDANGRPQDASLFERDVNGAWIALGTTMNNDLGEITREQAIDGNITRITKNPLGFPLRTYVGTKDIAWLDVEDGGTVDQDTYNMVLVDRTEYGEGLHDAWLPVVQRQYRSSPAWATDHHEAGPDVDADSYATVTSYDWRMRAVRVDAYDQGDPRPKTGGSATPERLSTSLSYLDHAGRPRMVVTYGAGPLSLDPALDPTELVEAAMLPSPTDFLPSVQGLRPTSLVTMEYGYDGNITETRTYDTGWDGTGATPYHAQLTYTGRGGQTVYSQGPSQPVTISRLDSFGRVTSTSSIRPDVGGTGAQHELSRTDYTYDGDGNISETAEWTRVDGQGDSLDGSNAVRTRTVNWYDPQKRLIATAELGTEDQAGNQWVFTGTGLYAHDPGVPPVWDAGSLTVERPSGLPDSAMLWFSVFDVYGNLTYAVDPAGVVTENQYSSTGRLVARIDNAAAPTEAEQRRTEYVHQYGRVVGLKATRAVAEGPDEVQYSGVRYQAQVVDENFAAVSGNNALASAFGLLGGGQPDPDTGEFPHDLEIRYTFGGQVAERIDARHVSFRYRYDALGRVDSIEVGHYPTELHDPTTWAAGYPASMTAPNGQDPADRVGYLDYLYDDRGGLAEVATYDRHPASGGLLITHNRYDYSARGEILADWQAQGQAVDPQNTPHTAYAWDYAPTDPTTGQTGRHRLASMLYPAHDASQPRDLYLAYGTPGSDDDLLSRITSIASSFGSAAEIATFDYVGVGRRYRTALADQNIVQTFKSSMAVGLVGLDMFGRPRDLRFENALFETLFAAHYTYDANGNRLAAELTQAPDAQGLPQHNIRSQLNAYDGLNRLVGTEVGSLIDGAIDPGTLVRDDTWNLDLLGNWSGGSLIGSADPGRISSGNLDGYGTPWAIPFAESAPDNWEYTVGVDDRNQLTLIKELDIDAGTTTRSDTPVYDAAGSLVFDGNYYFQYDAWNRLVQVNEATDMGGAGIVLGDLVKHYLYDGLGRLVRTQSPAGGGSSVRTERFYYDGLRRIQEFVTEPLTPLAGIDGDPTLEAIAEQTVSPQTNPDAQSAPTGFEQEQLGGGIGGGTPVGSIAREYVWGPGDTGPGFDELLVQYDENGEEAWAIQDAGGDLVALCDLGGGVGGGGGGTPDLARVVGQWTFDAYGEVLTAEHLFAFALPHLGHKGLFLDRLDGDGSSPRLVPFGHTIYHMRNRAYAPGLGRFLQRDPNQTAMALAESAAMHGRGLGALSLAFDLEGLYGDGGNLYEYLGSNPWNRSDPLGLSWDPFDVVDEFMVEHEISKAVFLQTIGAGVQAFAAITYTIVAMCPIPIIPDLALYASGAQGAGATVIGAALGVIPGGRLLARVGSAATRWFGRLKGLAFGTRTVDRAIGATGIVGEDFLRLLGGRSLVGFQTPLGWRVVDQVVGRFGHESKVGYQALTRRLQDQIAKDRALLALGRLDGIAWHFFRSPVTGKIGPSGPLRNALRNAGITVVEHLAL